jgi:hypothetical protein
MFPLGGRFWVGVDNDQGCSRTAQRAFLITFVLLILCVLGVLDKFTYNGLSLELQKYSPLILLVYSTTKLTLSALKPTIATREAILKAH